MTSIRPSPRPTLRAGRFAFVFLTIVMAAPPAQAAGINLAWDDCGRAGKADLAASCLETPIPYVLVGSVVPPPGLTRVNGFQAYIDVQFEGSTMPSWWEMGTGCRAGKISATFDFNSGPYSCSQIWETVPTGGMLYEEGRMYGGVVLGSPAGNRAYIRVIAAVAEQYERSMSPGTEYYLFKLSILKSGTLSCSGCKTPACIQLSMVRLTQPEPLDDAFVTERADMNSATWQGGIGSPDSDLPSCRADAVQNRSWGQVKNLYR